MSQNQRGQRQGRQSRRQSVGPLEDFGIKYHATIVSTETFHLLKYLLKGTVVWMVQLVRLLCFVVALLPAFLIFFLFYTVWSDRIAVPYVTDSSQKTSRHYLDIYGSTVITTAPNDKNKKPVVIFLTGGAWIIGYKMWGALLARTLVPFGIMVVLPDYRNFPQTDIEGMIGDTDKAVDFTLRNIAQYGGDPNKVVIAGQSAGAHIGACLLWRKALQATQKDKDDPDMAQSIPKIANISTTSWNATDIKGFIAVSGPYDLVAMKEILHKRGLDRSIVSAMFCNNVAKYSPTILLQELHHDASTKMEEDQDDTYKEAQLQLQLVRDQFPATCVLHGQIDKTVPFEISQDYYEALKALKLQQPVEYKVYPGWSHTDLILEAPFAGNHLFHRDVWELVQRWTEDGKTDNDGDNDEGVSLLLPFDESHKACAKICPTFLVEIARFCNPF